MIYVNVPHDEPIRQGDIFRNIPRAEFSVSRMAVVSEDESTELTTWRELVASGEVDAVTAYVGITAVTAIVISQDCDNARGKDLCLAQVENYLTLLSQEAAPKSAAKWQSLIIKNSKINPRLFYLPAEGRIGFPEKMGADFRTILRIPREDLLELRPGHRIARLRDVAVEHFREALAHFFRRYAYNEWYPLTKEEVDSYAASQKLLPSELFDWQK